jgi:hypothetical protein
MTPEAPMTRFPLSARFTFEGVWMPAAAPVPKRPCLAPPGTGSGIEATSAARLEKHPRCSRINPATVAT